MKNERHSNESKPLIERLKVDIVMLNVDIDIVMSTEPQFSSNGTVVL